MNEEAFLQRYRAEKEVYLAFGQYVKTTIINKLESLVDIHSFLKISVAPRLKDEESLLNKAFYRQKNYKDPYTEITDKVGLRFVVLLVKDIELIKEIIDSEKSWETSLDRDFEDERKLKPEVFTYQSVHYVVSNKYEIVYQGVKIAPKITCEIQIRTLLQHSYSELTHDRVYKSKTVAQPEVNRMIARSMALIETTDELFNEVNKAINHKQDLVDLFIDELSKIYTNIYPEWQASLSNINNEILDAYQDFINISLLDELKEYFTKIEEREIYTSIIKRRYVQALIFQQPIILFVGYMLVNRPIETLENWPFVREKLEEVANGFGISLESYD